MRPCAECGTPFPASPRGGRGRPRLYCSDRCRWNAANRRRRAVPLIPGPPLPPVTRAEIAEVLASLLPEEGRAARPQEELATTLLELQSAAGRLAYLEQHLPPRLAGRAALLSMRVREAIHLVFPEVVDP